MPDEEDGDEGRVDPEGGNKRTKNTNGVSEIQHANIGRRREIR